MSASINELSSLIESIRNVEKVKGSFSKKLSSDEIEIAKVARKSIVTKKMLPGENKIETYLLQETWYWFFAH